MLVVSFFTLFKRPILLTLFEPDIARTLGVPINLCNYSVFALLIFTLVTTLQAIGGILAIGLIVTPAATVRQPWRSTAELIKQPAAAVGGA